MENLHRIFAMIVLVPIAVGLRGAAAVGQVYDEQVKWANYNQQPDQPANGAANRVPAQPSETLEDAWRAALQSDERIKAGAWNVSAADQTRAAACAEGCPSVSVGGNVLALSDPIAFNSPAGEVPLFGQGSAGFHAIVSQPVYTAGKIDSQAAAAADEACASRADVERTGLDVKMNVAELYVAVLRGKRVVEVAGSKVVSLKAHALDVENRLQVDKASRNEVLAVQVALADARQQELRAANSLEMTKAAFNRALGRDMSEPVHIVELRDDGDPAPVDDLVRTAWQRRPEIRELSARAEALREQAAAAGAENSPQVMLRGGYIYQDDKYLQTNNFAGVALTAEWKLFDSGRAGHQAASLSQRAEATMRLRRDAESQIALEIRQHWLEFQTAKQQIAFARVAITQADENLRVVRDRYIQQLGNNTEVLDAETMRAQAYMNWYNSVYEAVLVRLRLRRAAGIL